MTWRSLTVGLTAGVAFLAFAASAHAQDTVRLKLTPANNDTPTLTLRSSGDEADVIDVRGYRGGGYRGGYAYRGGYGGYRGYYGGYRGYYGGYRGYYGGYGYAYYRPYRYAYYSPYYYGAPVYYYSSPSVYYYSPDYPISDTTPVTPSVTLRIGPSAGIETIPPPQALPPGAPRTYPYDGGPASPVPMPKPLPESTNDLKAAPSVVPDRSVSLPASGNSKFAYPAYGDTPRQTEFAADRVEKKSTETVVKKTAPR